MVRAYGGCARHCRHLIPLLHVCVCLCVGIPGVVRIVCTRCFVDVSSILLSGSRRCILVIAGGEQGACVCARVHFVFTL